VRENGIWVRLYEIDFVGCCEPQVDARVAVDCEETVDAVARLSDWPHEHWIEPFGELILQTPAFAVFLIPLCAIGGNLWLVRGHFAEEQLTDRKDGQPYVAHHADVEFAALDVFLRDNVAVVFLVNKSDPLPELVVGFDKRRPRNSVGGFFFHRLYQDRKLDLLGSPDALAARDDDEVRHVDTVIMQNLFRNALVLAKGKTGRAATGKRQALHFEKRNDVLVESGVIPELFDKVEKDIGRERLQFLPEKIDIVEDREMFGRVTERAERGHDVRLGFPILCFQLLAKVLIDGRRTCAVEKNENFEFLFHAIWCACTC